MTAGEDVRGFVESTRDDLGASLDEIEHRLTPQQLAQTATDWISRSYDKSPGAWLIGIGMGVVASVAAILWALTNDD
jgi:hypothetical protein